MSGIACSGASSVASKIVHRSETIQRLVEIYRDVVSRPSPVAGRFLYRLPDSNLLPVSISWNQRNLERMQMTEFQTSHLINLDTKKVSNLTNFDTSTELLSSLSKSEQKRCVVRQVSDEKNKKQFLEIWEGGRIKSNYDLAALDVHGAIYADVEFATLEWSPNEEKIVYVAEKKKPKSEPFYKQRSDVPDKSDKSAGKGEEYTFLEDWGEQLVGKSQPVVIVCDTVAGTLTEMTGISDDYSPSQLLWDQSGDGIFGVALENNPRRLGLIYCTKRKGVVFHLSTSGTLRILSEPDRSPRSCRLSPDGKYLVWLERQPTGPHAASLELVRCELSTGALKSIVPIINGSDGPFLGIYCEKLPRRCFTDDGNSLIFNTVWRNQNCAYLVHLETSQLYALRDKTGSLTVLDVFEDRLLVVSSNATNTSFVLIGGLPGTPTEDRIPITESVPLKTEAVAETILMHCNLGDYNCLLISPVQAAKRSSPLLVLPHGGPHSAIVDTYMVDPAFFVNLGFTVLLPNYIGSLGLGEQSINTLPGRIGDLDVKNVQDSVDYVIQNRDHVDPSKVVAYGGSHGGFLSLHLSGQYPEQYHAAVVRNPVVDLPSMSVTSDIPDWVFAEVGDNYDPASDSSAEARKKMADMSPIRYIAQVKAPTLLLVGSVDLRVPPSQPIHYYKLLKARGVKTKLHLYNDSHPLNKVPVHMDCLINSGLWILEALGIDISKS